MAGGDAEGCSRLYRRPHYTISLDSEASSPICVIEARGAKTVPTTATVRSNTVEASDD